MGPGRGQALCGRTQMRPLPNASELWSAATTTTTEVDTRRLRPFEAGAERRIYRARVTVPLHEGDTYKEVKALTHREFLEGLVRDLDASRYTRKSSRRSSEGSVGSQAEEVTQPAAKKRRATYSTKKQLELSAKERKEGHGEHTFTVLKGNKAATKCHACPTFRGKKPVRADMKCDKCNKHLCIRCWKPYHLLDDDA